MLHYWKVYLRITYGWDLIWKGFLNICQYVMKILPTKTPNYKNRKIYTVPKTGNLNRYPSWAHMKILYAAWMQAEIFQKDSKFRVLAWKNFTKLACNTKNLTKQFLSHIKIAIEHGKISLKYVNSSEQHNFCWETTINSLKNGSRSLVWGKIFGILGL